MAGLWVTKRHELYVYPHNWLTDYLTLQVKLGLSKGEEEERERRREGGGEGRRRTGN